MISFTKNETIIAVLTFIILATTVEETKSSGNSSADQLIQQWIEEIKEFDKDGDGKLNFDEFKEMMTSTDDVFLSEDSIKELFNEADTRHNGKINIDEYTTMLAKEYDNDLRKGFRKYDEHNKGYISGYELRKLLNVLKEHLTEEEIKNFDADGDGRINYEEYKKLAEYLH